MDESSSPIELLPKEPVAEVDGIEDPFVVAGGSGSRSNTLPAAGEVNRTVPLVSRHQAYARSVYKHSQTSIRTSLFCGQEYRSLAQFLMQRYHFKPEQHSQNQTSSFSGGLSIRKSKAQEEFAFLYELRPDIAPKAVRIPTPFSTPRAKQMDLDHNSLLILRGYPSPDWINFLGSRYNIDAEFFHRHLSFLPSAHGKLQRPAFQLPSSQSTIFQLSLTSAGVQDDSIYVDVNAKRMTAASDMDLYQHNLSVGQGWETGNSIVRSYDVHDGQYFSIEQTVTIYFGLLDSETEKWVVILWLDCGDDLSRSPPGPWLSAPRATFHTYFRPVVMYKPNISSKEHQVLPRDDNGLSDDTIGDKSSEYDLPQSLSLLAKFYGRSLNTSTMAVDPFYLLSELFAFASSSEVGMLNIIKSKLDQIWESNNQPDVSDPWSSQPDTSMHAQVSLIHYREILEERIHKIQETLTFIQNRDRLKWPRARNGKSTQTVERTEQDFQYLLTRARQLQERCDRDLTTIMNNITLAQARLGINQARRIFKFTILATTYVPLSFSTSVFSMAFVHFQQDSRGYLTWILVSIGVLAISIVIFTWDSGRIRRWMNHIKDKFTM